MGRALAADQTVDSVKSNLEEFERLRKQNGEMSKRIMQFEADARGAEVANEIKEAALRRVHLLEMELASRDEELAKAKAAFEAELENVRSGDRDDANSFRSNESGRAHLSHVFLDTAMAASRHRINELTMSHNHLLKQHTPIYENKLKISKAVMSPYSAARTLSRIIRLPIGSRAALMLALTQSNQRSSKVAPVHHIQSVPAVSIPRIAMAHQLMVEVLSLVAGTQHNISRSLSHVVHLVWQALGRALRVAIVKAMAGLRRRKSSHRVMLGSLAVAASKILERKIRKRKTRRKKKKPRMRQRAMVLLRLSSRQRRIRSLVLE